MPVFVSLEEYTWKQAKDLVTGDRIVYVGTGIEGIKTALPSWEYIRPLIPLHQKILLFQS